MDEIINQSNNELSADIPSKDMMLRIAKNQQDFSDIKLLTSDKITDQLKVFLVSQARNELMRVVKLTNFLDRIENNYMSLVDQAMIDNSLTLRQYNDILVTVTSLLARSNEIITKVLKDDSLTTILNTTIYTTSIEGSSNSSTVINQLKDSQSREKVRNVINTILLKTKNYNPEDIVEGSSNEEIQDI